VCYGILRILGWRMAGAFPDSQKFIMIGAPHTSNWDFFYAMLFKYASGLQFKWIGKASLFKPPFGKLFLRLGGIPVWREKKSNFVAQISDLFALSEHLVIAIAPEGTRQQTAYWKSGFYFMAVGARVPIVLGFLDYGRKQIGLGPMLHPTGDIQADFLQIQDFYADKRGANPANQNPITLLPPIEQSTTQPQNIEES
jgi:1-acyl-sn-glycerol-3-phosphate acyltransferase